MLKFVLNMVSDWNAAEYFSRIISENKLAVDLGVRFCRVSGLQGFEDCLSAMSSAKFIVAVSDTEQGVMSADNSPHSSSMKLIFFAGRHPVNNMEARTTILSQIRELFRQLYSRLMLEQTQLEETNVYLDSNVSFTEMNRYFFSGCACAYFQIRCYSYQSFEYNPDEWLT